jgi:uncharacterized protein YdeI (YjbR/CyaY-like superfamily)
MVNFRRSGRRANIATVSPRSSSPSDDLDLVELADRAAWDAWLAEHHASAPGVWLKLAKKASPTATVSQADAVEVALCWGWIDGQVGRLDEFFYRQRFTPRRPRSGWSQVNVEKATRLIEQGLMRPAGLAAVDAAKADGRWAAAYAPASRATIPDDLEVALAAEPEAKAFFETLSSANRYAVLYRVQQPKRPETRARRIAELVEMLARHETFH